MKIYILLLFFTSLSVVNAQVAINTDNTNPDPSSMLDVKSIDKGLLLPRMTQAQRDAIVSPAEGLMVYQTENTPGLYYNSGTSASPIWVIAGNGSGWGLTGNSGTAPGTNFLGTTDDVRLAIKVNNQPAGEIDHMLFNTSWGYQSLGLNTTGINNTANGQAALFSNTTGNSNTAAGAEALFNNTSGYSNTAIGRTALFSNTAGFRNTATGNAALYSNTTGNYNTANGQTALYSNTTGSYNIANGAHALFNNTTGDYNTANGSDALYYNTEGYRNTASGSTALYSNTGGDRNTAIGYSALYSNTTGSNNTATGNAALNFNTTGNSNIANGQAALFRNTTGSNNVANGAYALTDNTTGDNNTANGAGALHNNTEGNRNTASGDQALYYNTVGDYNCAFGYSASFNSGTLNNTTCLGHNAGGVGSGNNRVEIGNTSVSVIAGQVGFSTYSDERIKDNIQDDVPGLAFIKQLRPVTYNLNIHRQNKMVYKGTRKDGDNWDSKYDIEKIKMTGFVAQEVEKAATASGYDFSGVQKPANPDELYSLRYSDFVVPLVKAVQEQQTIIDNQNKKIDELIKRIESLENK